MRHYCFIFFSLIPFLSFEQIKISNNGEFVTYKRAGTLYSYIYSIKEKKLFDSIVISYAQNDLFFSNNSKYLAYLDTNSKVNIYSISKKRSSLINNKLFKTFNEKIKYSLCQLFFSSDDKELFLEYTPSKGFKSPYQPPICVIFSNYLSLEKCKISYFKRSISTSNVNFFADFKNMKQYSLNNSTNSNLKLIKYKCKINENKGHDIEIEKGQKIMYNLLNYKNEIQENNDQRESGFVSISPTGKYLLVGISNISSNALVYESDSLNLISKIKSNSIIYNEESHPFRAHFSKNQKLILTLHKDKKLRLWNVKSGKLIAKMNKKIVPNFSIDSLNIDYGFWNNGSRNYIFYCYSKKNNPESKEYLLMNCENLLLNKKFDLNSIPVPHYEHYIGNEKYSFGLLENSYFITHIQPTNYFITYNLNGDIKIQDSKTFKLVKKIESKVIKEFGSSRNYINYKEINYLDKFIFISDSQILETNWSIIDFLNTLNLPNK